MKRIISVILLSGLLGACQTTDGGSDNFKRSLNNTSHGYQVVTAPHPVRFGKVSERFEVRNGDCSSQDCATDRERSELAGPRYSGGPHWYGWSFYVPKDHVNIFPTRTTLGQFHQGRSGQQGLKPVFMFQNHGGGLWAERHVMGGVGVSKNLIPAVEFKGKWHDIVVKAVWARSNEGEITVWVNGVEKYNFRGFTTLGYPVYLKYGVYRTSMVRYKIKYAKSFDTSDDTIVPTQIVYYDEVRHGRTRAEVDIRIIEKMGAGS